MKVALVYDRVNKWGGAEQVLLALHELFPSAPLYTALYDPKKAPWASVFPKIIPSFLQKIPFLNKHHELLGWLMPIAYETFCFNNFDLVISVTSEAAKGIITKPKTKHICICLTPTRYLWSHYNDYFKGASFKGITKPIVNYLRSWDVIAAQRPDKVIAISSEVQKRIRKYYKRESEIIFPPVDVKRFQVSKSKINKIKADNQLPSSGFYLIVSRLVPYKKIDLAIEAFNELRYPLVVVGTGSEEKRLKSVSYENIVFAGFVSEEELIKLYQGAKAFIFPNEEDFGIAAVEAQAAGIPVISYNKGGSCDSVIDTKTGIYFKHQNKEGLINAVKKFNDMRFDKKVLIKNAERFSKDRFKKEFLDMLGRIR